MVKSLPALLAGFCVAACDLSTYDVVVGPSGHRVHFTGGDGSSPEKAIVIHEAKQDTGVFSEFDYLWARYPGYQHISQDFARDKGKVYSVRTFFDAEGKQHVLYFDESEYYGKL